MLAALPTVLRRRLPFLFRHQNAARMAAAAALHGGTFLAEGLQVPPGTLSLTVD